MADWTRRLLPTNAWVRFAIAPALVFIALATDRNYLADFWHHLARGRAMAAEGALVDRDLFTFTVAGQEFRDVNWLTQVFYYFLYEQGGLELVQVVNASVLAVTLGLLVVFCRRVSGSSQIAAGVGIVTFFGLWQILAIRPQTFSLLLFVLLYDLLDRAERRPWLLAIPPLLLALWANLHGAFPAGLMLIGCFALAGFWRKLQAIRQTGALTLKSFLCCTVIFMLSPWSLCLAASALATLVNAYGWNIYGYVGLTSNTAALRRIDEWVPPTLDLWIGKAWLVSLVVMLVLIAACWKSGGRRLAAREIILIALFLPLACGSVRMVAWWLLLIAPLVAARLAWLFPQARDEPSEEPSRGAGVVFGLIGVAVVLSLPGLQRFNPLLATRSDQRTEGDLDVVRARLADLEPTGRVFTRFEWGEYLTWSYWPSYTIFMDGRIEIYPDPVWEDYSTVTCGKPSWDEVLDKYRVDVLLLDADYHARTGLLPRVEKSEQWRCMFQQGTALVYLRQASSVARAR
jgi:hypothetical protein